MSNRQQRKARKERQRAAARLARGETGGPNLVEWMRARRQRAAFDQTILDECTGRINARHSELP